MKKLTYFIHDGKGNYEPFYEYTIPQVGLDEFYARQLCTYFIVKGSQYELISNEMDGDEEILVLEDRGRNHSVLDEKNYRGLGIHVEFRRYQERENYKLLTAVPCSTHLDVIRYLLKDVTEIPGFGQMAVTSTEIDEDRGVYVVYVKNLDEPNME
ncbi:RNA helicase [Mesobacillus subterraneus]|uniref:RNA helicase n=1 Tax=Mesobacillus subterraneus TaxID=285983 RepID=A0A3R9E3S2_9BACI|nr:RNA helicase [Mesobacillus subterraneus]RSD25471.1 RNA helicase [Mesobacillus subterraneus]